MELANGAAAFAYKDLLLFLATAAVIVPLVGRLKVPPQLGFLVGGLALGPFGLGALARQVPWLSAVAIIDLDEIAPLAEFGVAFLLFVIGLELSLERLQRMRKLVFGMGSLQVVVTSAALGLIALLLGQSPASAAVLGSALAMSSTALVLPSLAEGRRVNSATGRASFAVLLFQDLAVAPLLFMVSLLGTTEGAGLGTGILYALAPAVIALVVLVVAGRLVLRPLFQLAAATKRNEVFVAACLLVAIGTGLLVAAAGQPMELGAFIAGLLLAETEYRRQVEVTIQPFQGLLLGLFFVSVGASLDLSLLIREPLTILAILAGFLAVKAAIAYPLGLAFRLSRSTAGEVALMLAPSGEFALVLIGAALAVKVVPAGLGSLVLVAVTVSMFAVPVIARLTEEYVRRPAYDEAALAGLAPAPHDGPARVIVVGFGRVGELVGQMLSMHGIPYLVVDANPAVVTAKRDGGIRAFYGDATQVELLRICGIANALALAVTMDDPAATELVVTAARAERPDIPIIARARDASHAQKLYGLSVTDAVPENIEASLQLSEALLAGIGVPMGKVIASVHEKRAELRGLLKAPPGSPERRAVRPATRPPGGAA
ncbi:MAG: cation:proton antiporter [Bauldia sp.]